MPIIGTIASQISGHLSGPASYESIQTQTVASNTQSITFSSIPSTYKDLEIRYISRDTYTNTFPGLQVLFNGGTFSTVINLFGNGTGTAPGSGQGFAGGYAYLGWSAGNDIPANLYAGGILRLFGYASANKTKVFENHTGVQREASSSGSGYIALYGGSLNSTSAITSITFQEGDPNFKLMPGSTYALYGIKG